ncbi:tetratricopeptide repeat protein [Actomonas aquatica]|uniref:Tetratricopeptide repeat protein n=1 Tax=Actomonas aquatica TaxID=2866162 RepID=A0ABZ1C5N4_9BACT|nr:tetratricopeptide repeat protein [Opitutus sp. WL0086]WRQ86826.1 tetratricopeptide repeat protein [Opitutus sp. WL0086]
MKPRALIALILGVLLLGGVAAGAFWLKNAGAQQAAVAPWIPPIPDTAGFPPALNDAFAAAEAKAYSRGDSLKGLKELSALLHANGFFDSAILTYQGLAEIEPNEARWPHLHASILAGFGMSEDALALWDRVTELAPDYLPARLRIGDIALKSNDLPRAIAAYEAADRIDDGNAYALLGLARIDIEKGNEAAALDKLETIVRRTNYTLGYDLIVTLYENAGETAKADAIRGQAEASGAFRDPPDPWLDGLLAFCYDPFRVALEAGTKARIGETDTAIELLHRALELDPLDVSTHFQLGNLYKQQRQFQDAMAEFRRCTLLDPSFADGWAQLSGTLAQIGNVAEADRVLNAGLDAVPDSPGLHLMRARRHRAANNNGAAINDYRASIRLRPNEPEPYIELAIVLLNVGRNAEAVRQFETALVYDPANPTALTALAFQAIETGNRERADEWLQKVDAQPRIDRNQTGKLREAYRKQFGVLPNI